MLRADKFFRPKNWTDREFEQLRASGSDAAGPSTPAAAPAEAKQDGADETAAAEAQLDEAAGASDEDTVLLEVSRAVWAARRSADQAVLSRRWAAGRGQCCSQ